MKIKIDKKKGPVVFLGSMNAMPMMYAIELKKLGYDVIYFVDRPKTDLLSRPENHFQDIAYPYPSWVVEFNLKTQIFLPLFRKAYARKISKLIKKVTSSPIQAFVLNGFFCSLSLYLSHSAQKITLAHGSDFDSWSSTTSKDRLTKAYKNKSVFRVLPPFLSKKLIHRIVDEQYSGVAGCDKVIYFPKGFNKYGDEVIDKLESKGLQFLERYDVSFEPLKNEPRGYKERSGLLKIFSGVRFTFETFTENDEGYSKGNDKIIYGLAEFYRIEKNIEVHFVEKGTDVAKAKKLCNELGLSDVVIWHKEMSFIELLNLYKQSDICFDQVGEHWIGAIGCYALWLGKPLIANDTRPVHAGIWPIDNPVCSATTSAEVASQLLRLLEDSNRKMLSQQSMVFAEEYLGPSRLLSKLIQEA